MTQLELVPQLAPSDWWRAWLREWGHIGRRAALDWAAAAAPRVR